MSIEFTCDGCKKILRVAESAAGTEGMALLIKDGEYYRTRRIDYRGGTKYPHLVRDESKPDVMADIIKAHSGATVK